ncbi:MAG: hypothetical protein KF685_08165 [Acidobacteria bacterium]|nr:hypothetical protein [Acidobacteriota bacterium]
MKRNLATFVLVSILLGLPLIVNAQKQERVRTVSIPISIYTKDELRQGAPGEMLQVDSLTVLENKEEQTILSIRSVVDAPLALAILIQDDVTSEFNLQLRDIAAFIRGLPKGSRVMVAYLRAGSMDIRQKFTDDLDKAARSLRMVASSSSLSPRSPYDSLVDALNRFDALPAGRRAVLMVSDGLDLSEGGEGASPSMSTDLNRAILRAQRRSVSVFSFYSSTVYTESGNSMNILNGQSSLLRLSEETGGRAFFQGNYSPVSFDPFFKQLNVLLTRQFLLSYLTTNMKKGYYKVEVVSSNKEVRIEHPKGYYYR